MHGQTIKRPQTRIDYIRMCRRFIDEDDFVAFMKAIFDAGSYDKTTDDIRDLVDCYYTYAGVS